MDPKPSPESSALQKTLSVHMDLAEVQEICSAVTFQGQVQGA